MKNIEIEMAKLQNLADQLAAALKSVLDGLGALCNQDALEGWGLAQEERDQIWAALAAYEKAKEG